MALPPPPPPSGGGSGGGGSRPPRRRPSRRRSSSGGAQTSSKSSNRNKDPWVYMEKGKIRYSFKDEPPKGALKVFGLPAKRSDFLQARSHYNDLFRAWLGRPARPNEVANILQRGVSDYALRLQLVQKKGFKKSAMYKNIRSQAGSILGFDYKIDPKTILQAMKSEGGISEASLRTALATSQRARTAVRRSFMSTSGADVQYLSGAFGQGALGVREREALALQASGLRPTTLGARLQGQLDTAMKRMERVFQGQLATPNLSIGPAGLQAPSLQPQQEPDLPAG